MEARTNNTKLFYKLVKQQRGLAYNQITEIHVNDEIFKGNNIMDGWNKHFKTLATPDENVQNTYDEKYHQQVNQDITVIRDICSEDAVNRCETNFEEVHTATKLLNSGKSPDAYGVTSEQYLLWRRQTDRHTCIYIQRHIQITRCSRLSDVRYPYPSV